MRVRFWGTRGSIPKPGPSTIRYGGNTSCIEVRSSRGTLIVIDCGTGAHGLGQALMMSGVSGIRGHILISHTHWDHIQGIPFFEPLFAPGNQWDIYGPKGLDLSVRETLAGQMQYTYFPITPDQFRASIHYHDLMEGTFYIDDVKITTYYLNHPALTLGYRLETDGVSVVYCCDHEPHSRLLANGEGAIAGQEIRYGEFIANADLLIHDAQYTAEEYPAKMGWGHSTVEYAIKMAKYANVKKLIITHHDPSRDDDALDRIVARLKSELKAEDSSLKIGAAAEGEVIEVKPEKVKAAATDTNTAANSAMSSDKTERTILLNINDASTATLLNEVMQAEGMKSNYFSTIDEAKSHINSNRPSLVILEHKAPHLDGIKTCQAIQALEHPDLPIVMIGEQEDLQAGNQVGVTDWLIKPFSNSYARTKIRAWVLRTECRWERAPNPANEKQRLSALYSLKILDTKPEERFDRITRLAAALFDVPVALVSLVDENRQWFKSCFGVNATETSRDMSFCSHVVYSQKPMVVTDTLLDPRFADSPFVVNEPRIRFYAGYPLLLSDGSCIGTLCLLDTRPRNIEGEDLERLRDLAHLVLEEIKSPTSI